ncbi:MULTISPECIES: aminoacyl-histidine dipeptidase [unclassified Aureispira]|uniref:aminoacyl-histidine dipeptidase n=1 Tax=unclassified Aureispira TaxID=2649989 RepID=UPI000696ACBB|nr:MULTISPECIES: aminoacyl-histidine dipeptidase [unclassified Aureispira]WMX16203.1 aminoacyl-histidine dipeptidase [Aureispira sp. CCB-E]
MKIQDLQPKALWKNFANLNAVPRPSKKEERVIAFAKKFGEDLGLPTHVDEVGNVIIKKPATEGMENRTTVVLQSHLDMVHQKNADTDFDFDKEGIKMLIDGDWVKADGTTLGADNGIGVAAIMALLESTDIAHPPLEALFTIDEETGMTGAMGLVGGLLDAKIMLNLDTEDDDELTIGCAGGVDVTAKGTYEVEKTPENYKGYKLAIKGLSGGHSGMDIHRGLGNANKLMNRLLYNLNKVANIRIASIDGGSLRNAIPRESFAAIAVETTDSQHLSTFVEKWQAILENEYKATDPDLKLILEPCDVPSVVCSKTFQKQFLAAVYACPCGIYRMSPEISDLVQTSNNLARVLLKDGAYQVLCLTRGSVDTEKQDEADAIVNTFELIGAVVTLSGAYPGWAPNPNADIIKIMSNLYQEMYQETPHVYACHAGLECGILGTNYPDMEMISFGPNIRGAHSPDEKVQISSVQKFWDYLLATLKRIPEAS